MGISTAIRSSLLPQSLASIQNFLKEDAERKRQEEERKKISEAAGEITKMFSRLPENATIEQINNVTKQAMVHAFKQDAKESLSVIDPLNKMAQGELSQRNELSASSIMGSVLGIQDKDILKLPVQTMLEAMRMTEALKKRYTVRDEEGRTVERTYNLKGELTGEVMLDPTTTRDRMSGQVEMVKREAIARNEAEKMGYNADQGKFSYIGTQNGMGVVLNNRTGKIETSEIQMDSKTQAKVRLGQINQAVETYADDIINTVTNSNEDAMKLFSEEFAERKGRIDKEAFLEKLYAKGYIEKAKEDGLVRQETLVDYWKAKWYRTEAAGQVSGLSKEKTKKKVEGF